MTLRTRGVDCECEKVISSTIYKTEDNLVSIYKSYLQDCLRGDAVVDFYSREID